MRRKHVDRVAAHAEGPADKIGRHAAILQRDEVGDELALLELLVQRDREGHRRIGFDRADAVDAGDRRDDDHVVALQKSAGRGVAHPVDLLVHRGFFLDVGVRARHIGFGLVIVVIGDEILHGVLGEEALELAVELRGERLVRREDQRRPLRAGDDLRHREGLAGAGDAEQHLIALLRLNSLEERLDRLRLVAARLVFGNELEFDAAFGLRWPFRTMRRPGCLVAHVRIAEAQQLVETVDRRLASGVHGGAAYRCAAALRPVVRLGLREPIALHLLGAEGRGRPGLVGGLPHVLEALRTLDERRI